MDCTICGEPVVLRSELCLIWLENEGRFSWETFKSEAMAKKVEIDSADIVLRKRTRVCHSCWGSVLIAFERGLRKRFFEESI